MPISFEVGEAAGTRGGTPDATQFGVQGCPCRERRGLQEEWESWSHRSAPGTGKQNIHHLEEQDMDVEFPSWLASLQAALLSCAQKCQVYLSYSSSQGSLPCSGSAPQPGWCPQPNGFSQTLFKASLELYLHSLSSSCSQTLHCWKASALMARGAGEPWDTDNIHFPARLATTSPY